MSHGSGKGPRCGLKGRWGRLRCPAGEAAALQEALEGNPELREGKPMAATAVEEESNRRPQQAGRGSPAGQPGLLEAAGGEAPRAGNGG